MRSVRILIVGMAVLAAAVSSLAVSMQSQQVSRASLQLSQANLQRNQASLQRNQDRLADLLFSDLLSPAHVQIVSRAGGGEMVRPYTIYYTLTVDGETANGKCVFADETTCEL